MRLIDADKVKSKLQQHRDLFVDAWGGFDKMSLADKNRVDEIDNCIAEIVNAPTIEATPVVHGRWEAVHDGWGRCPNCHRMDSIHEKATHCRFCGTKMDGGVSDG